MDPLPRCPEGLKKMLGVLTPKWGKPKGASSPIGASSPHRLWGQAPLVPWTPPREPPGHLGRGSKGAQPLYLYSVMLQVLVTYVRPTRTTLLG